MSIDHLQALRDNLPVLFEDRLPPTDWVQNVMRVRIENVEAIANETDTALSPSDYYEGPVMTAQLLEESALELLNPNIVAGVSEKLRMPVDLGGFASGSHAGSYQATYSLDFVPPPDAWAFYLPYHYFYPRWWGIYLTVEGVLQLANEILDRSERKVSICY